jgi:tuberculosinol/isotuberculosinol synthase
MLVDSETFHSLSAAQVAQLVRAKGPKVCVFPINGTRRWFMLEYSLEQEQDFGRMYLDKIAQRHIELYRLFFDHGLDTLLTPAFGPDLMSRGEGYVRMAAEGLSRLATHPEFLEFFQAYGVRVRFYGEYPKFFGSSPHAYLLDLFDRVTARTATHDRHRLFFGLFAHDATETVAELAVRYHAEHGCVPDKRTLVELYYGEYVEPVDLFIGFDKFSVFDMPLVALGNEDLYFTVSPSPYLTQGQLRDILYDHLYARREEEPDYLAMRSEDWALMREFYRLNQEKTLGVGARHKRGGGWYPLPQVKMPAAFSESLC